MSIWTKLIKSLAKKKIRSATIIVLKKVLFEGLSHTQEKYVKKLVVVMAISLSMTKARKKIIFERIPFIWYLIWFKKNQENIRH